MRKHGLFLKLACCFVLSAVASAALPPKSQILADGLKATKHWLSSSKNVFCGWEDGTLMIGIATLQTVTGDAALLQQLEAYGDAYAWNMCLSLGGAAWNPDNQVCAASYAELYLSSNTSNRTDKWIQASQAHLDAEIAANSTTVRNWNWLDALFMAMSVYARIGAITGVQKYFDKMFANFQYSALNQHPDGYGYWSQADGLFYRDPPKGMPAGVFWSRGNGWAAAALVQALKYSPAGEPHVSVYVDVFRQHVARLAQLQGVDGCWRTSLTDPGFNPVPETTGTAMFAYAISYGITAGILDAATYQPVVEQAWSCLSTVALHADGTVGNCQPGGAGPQRNFGPDTTNSFCVGQFAMAAAGVAQLAE